MRQLRDRPFSKLWRIATLVLALSAVQALDTKPAHAFSGCNEACAVIAYALITGGGLTTAGGAQVSLLRGEPDTSWGYLSLGFAGANAGTAGILLLVAGIMAGSDDEETAVGFGLWGGIQMSIAVAGLVSGAHVVANDDPDPPGASPRARSSGATFSIPF